MCFLPKELTTVSELTFDVLYLPYCYNLHTFRNI